MLLNYVTIHILRRLSLVTFKEKLYKYFYCNKNDKNELCLVELHIDYPFKSLLNITSDVLNQARHIKYLL